jgi:hypothetical protein
MWIKSYWHESSSIGVLLGNASSSRQINEDFQVDLPRWQMQMQL